MNTSRTNIRAQSASGTCCELSDESDTWLDLPDPPPAPPGVGLMMPDAIADLRTIAKTSHYPRNRLYPLLADLAEAERATHIAATHGDREAKAASEMWQWEIHGTITAEQEKAADSWLSMMALAVEHRPREVAELFATAFRTAEVKMALVPILVDLMGPTTDWLVGEQRDVRDRIENLEAVTAEVLS